MKRILLIAALLALPISVSTQGPPHQSNPCFAKATTQAEATACAGKALDEADAELNLVYQQLLKKHVAHKDFIKRLKLAQEAWLKFRDAHIESLYPNPDEDQLRPEGTVYPMCKAMEITRVTVERTRTLKSMLNPKEGDVCGF
jgi:uncharacterized protein YecT (DUF1311 family)